tara:strand:+ start:370 stop:489 length:120 start_codon:yes stop_codon:yes gene_type:complete
MIVVTLYLMEMMAQGQVAVVVQWLNAVLVLVEVPHLQVG